MKYVRRVITSGHSSNHHSHSPAWLELPFFFSLDAAIPIFYDHSTLVQRVKLAQQSYVFFDSVYALYPLCLFDQLFLRCLVLMSEHLSFVIQCMCKNKKKVEKEYPCEQVKIYVRLILDTNKKNKDLNFTFHLLCVISY